ncbi:unnamed protein product, partial [Amoebophrya sp. A120]
ARQAAGGGAVSIGADQSPTGRAVLIACSGTRVARPQAAAARFGDIPLWSWRQAPAGARISHSVPRAGRGRVGSRPIVEAGLLLGSAYFDPLRAGPPIFRPLHGSPSATARYGLPRSSERAINFRVCHE